MNTFTAVTLDELAKVAGIILADLKASSIEGAAVLTLAGELGAGKTAFVQQLGTCLGVADTIVSPTFVVMKRYETTDERFTELVHIDAYRLEGEAETIPLHIADIFKEPKTLVCIEWATMIPTALPASVANLDITDTAGTRTLMYTPYGQQN